MRDADVKEMRDEVAKYFKEIWPIIRNVIGVDNEDTWKAMVDKASEYYSDVIIDVKNPQVSLNEISEYAESRYRQLTVKEQVRYEFGRFLFHMLTVVENANKQLKIWDGEKVAYSGGFQEEKR